PECRSDRQSGLLLSPPSSKLDSQPRAEVQPIRRISAHFLVILIQQVLHVREQTHRISCVIRTSGVQLCIPAVEYRLAALVKPRPGERINVSSSANKRTRNGKIIALFRPVDLE